jgi:CheY-like chemotaxis protein
VIQAQADNPAAPTIQTTQARVLVVDDERSMRELLSIVLRREGYEVTLAEDGRRAIEQLERAHFDSSFQTSRCRT